MIEQANFTYSSLGIALEKQTKTIEDQVKSKEKHLKIMGNIWFNLMILLQRILISTEITCHLKKKENI